MVPVADMFNHKTDKESVRIFGEDEASSSSDDEEEQEQEEQEDQNNKKDSEPTDSKEYLEMFLVRDVARGGEVFNTFGIHGNSHLIHKYGFAELDNDHVTVFIKPSLMIETFSAGEWERAAEALGISVQQEQEEGDGSEDEDEDDEDDENSVDLEIGKDFMSEQLKAVLALMSIEDDYREDSKQIDKQRKRLVKEYERSSRVPAEFMHTPSYISRLHLILEARMSLYGDSSSSSQEDLALLESDENLVKCRAPAGGGNTFAGVGAAVVLRITEKQVLEAAFLQSVELLRELKQVGNTSKSKSSNSNGKKKRRKVVSGVCYDPTVVFER